MSKKSIAAVAAISLASLNDQEQALKNQLAAIAAKRDEVRKQETEKITAIMDGFPAQLAAVVGRPVDMKEAVSLLGQRLRGTFGSLVTNTGTNADKGKRLSDETKAQLRKELLARAVALKREQPAEPLTVIAARHGIQPQTCDTYKPTVEQVTAALAAIPAPAPVAATA